VSEPALISQAWRLARRELRGGLRGFGVFLGCLFLGVFAIAAVGSFSAAARQGLLSDARALLGGDLEIHLVSRELNGTQQQFLAPLGDLSTVVEIRSMARAVNNANRTLVEIKAVDAAYPLYGSLASDPPQPLNQALAVQPDGVFGVLAEATLLDRLAINVGDEVRLGGATLRITGILTREPDRTLRAFTLGPRLLVGQKALAATGLMEPGSLFTSVYRLRLPPTGDAAAVKERLQAAFSDAGWRVRTWREAAPQVRRLLDRMTLNLTLIGLCSLLIGGVGVAGAVRGYLSGKVFNIATMKCVGATGRTIFAGYLLQVLLLGGVGATAGLAAGAALPWLAQSLVGDSLPIPLQLGFYPGPLVTAAFCGLLVSLIFSLQELGAARRISPSVLFRGYSAEQRLAPGAGIWTAIALLAAALAILAVVTSPDKRLAFWFILGAFVCFAIFRALAALVVAAARRAPRPRRPSLRLALANIHRRGSPAGTAVFSLGLGLTALVIVALVQANLTRLVDETIPAEAPAFLFLDIQPDQVVPFTSLVDSLPGVTRSERHPTLRGRIVAIAGVAVDNAQIAPGVEWAVRGDRWFSYAARMPEGTRLIAGSWWPADYQGPPLLSLTADLAKGFGVGVGDTLTVNVLGREITARIASLREVDWSTLNLNFALLFSPGVLENAPQTNIASVNVPSDREQAVFRAVTDRFPNVSAIGVRSVLAGVSRTLGRLAAAFRAMAAVALLSGFLVLAGAVSADQHRRIRDAVIFKVCGATRRNLLTAFAAEFLLLGFAAGAISALVGTLAAWGLLVKLMDTPFILPTGTVFATLATGIGLTLVLGLTGTWKALGQKPAVWLRKE
jgi:putative ABC transport system permease protein